MSHETAGRIVLAIDIIAIVAGLILFLFLWPVRSPEKKVKIHFEVDEEAAEKARKEISRLQGLIQEMGALARRGRDNVAELFERYMHLARWIQDDRDAAEAEVERLKAENKKLRRMWSETGTIAAHRVGRIIKLSTEAEQLRVQLAGCDVAALGATSPGQVAVKGEYGWSAAYQSVLNLRRRYDDLEKRHLALTAIDDSEPTNPGR